MAEELQRQLGADIERIEAVNPYDGDFQATIERSGAEMKSGELPAIQPLKVNLADYDLIFIGFPVWFGTYAMPVATLVAENTFEGKTVVPFCTFGSGGLNTSTDALRKALPKADIRQGYGVREARMTAAPKELNRFLIENGYKEGTVTPLPDYSPQQPVTEADVAIFNAACSDYQFPLGTPLTVGSRETDESTDYKFTVQRHSVFPNSKPQLSLSVQPWTLSCGLCDQLIFTIPKEYATEKVDIISRARGKITFDKFFVLNETGKTYSSFGFFRNGEVVLEFDAERIYFNKPSGQNIG